MVDVFILGAGFSKSLSRHMPTLSDLGQQFLANDRFEAVREETNLLKAFALQLDNRTTSAVDVEKLLTYLAQDQPYLRQDITYKNRSTFFKLVDALTQSLLEIEDKVVDEDPPQWLLPLIKKWENDDATVATFNDTLIERAYLRLIKDESRRDRTHRSIYGVPITPAEARRGFTWSEGGGEAFTYLKMHGSLNWFYSGAESFYGEPVYDLPLLAWGQDIPEGYAERRGEFVRLNVPDKVPLVLPPATDKSLWLNNEILRGQWLTLGDSLRMADRVIAVGYSLPQTDTLNTSFLLPPVSIARWS